VSISDATKCTNDSAGVGLQVDVLILVINQVFIEHLATGLELCKFAKIIVREMVNDW